MTGLQVSGRHLRDCDGGEVVLRGVNLPLLHNWNFPGSDALSEIEKTGANTIRIQWYANFPNPERPPYSVRDLDDFLGRCGDANIVPIVMLADLTCSPDAELVNSQLIPWWMSADVAGVLSNHSEYVVINLANEAGIYRRADKPKRALAAYSAAYQKAVASIRAAGLSMPIMIDAPDCGTSLDAFTKVGRELIDADPNRNILLSAHTYWAAYDGMPWIDLCLEADLPIVFGEIANKQDGDIEGETAYCYYDLDGSGAGPGSTNGFQYQVLLSMLQDRRIGWLAWSWHPDGCRARQISVDGSYLSLTEYGEDIIENPAYGIRATSRRAVLKQL